MTQRFRLSRLHLTRLEEQGVPVAEVARRAALPPDWGREERPQLDTVQLFAFWRAVADVSGNPLLGLRLGGEDHVERYDPIALAVLSSSTFRDAIDRAARYKQLTCPEEIRVVGRGREWRVQFRWTMTRGDVPTILHDLCFAWVMTLGRIGTGHRIVPLRVEFTRPSANRKAYENHFGCPVYFNADADSLVLDVTDLDRSFRTRNHELLAMIAPHLDAELADLNGGSIAGRAMEVVKRILAGRRPELSDVARELGVSTRTLQRRLAADGSTYQQILEDARRDLARQYLLQSTLDLSETAYLLGYEDANSFFRAFQQWEGDSPGRWREERRRTAIATGQDALQPVGTCTA
jgi:AraC-like DNA-binding protein